MGNFPVADICQVHQVPAIFIPATPDSPARWVHVETGPAPMVLYVMHE